MEHAISFPALGLDFNINRVAVNLRVRPDKMLIGSGNRKGSGGFAVGSLEPVRILEVHTYRIAFRSRRDEKRSAADNVFKAETSPAL